MKKKSLKNSTAFIGTNEAAAKKAEQQERVLQLVQSGAGEVALAADAARNECLDAIKERFDMGIETLEMSVVIGFFAAMEIGAPKSIAKRIAMHPMRPAEVDAIVEAAEAEEKARKDEERRLRKIEVLRKRLAAREEDEQKLAELEAEAAGGKKATGDTPDPKAASGKPTDKSDPSAEA